MSTEEAVRRGLVCVACRVTRSRTPLCRSCLNRRAGDPQLRIETIVGLALDLHFPGILGSTGVMVGGVACEASVGNECGTAKTKRASPDLFLVTRYKYIYVETDENRHDPYNASCELARYDTIHHGTSKLLPSIFIRSL